MKVKEVADLVGISVRTLHHYDEIALLVPDTLTEAGHREYSEANIDKLQQILIFKTLDFPLKQIKEVIQSPNFKRQEVLEIQRKMLLDKRERMDQMIEIIDKSIQHAKGEISMTNQEKFRSFDFSRNPYEQEARDRWGAQTVDKVNKKAKQFSETDKESFN